MTVRNPYRGDGYRRGVAPPWPWPKATIADGVAAAALRWIGSGGSAAQMRWAARHSCRRLRAERDEARERVGELMVTAAQVNEHTVSRCRELEAERDTLRAQVAELRAAIKAAVDADQIADPWDRQTDEEKWELACAMRGLVDALAATEPKR